MSGLMYEAAFENTSMGFSTDNIWHATLGGAAMILHYFEVTTDSGLPVKRRIGLGTSAAAILGGVGRTPVPMQRRNPLAATVGFTVDSDNVLLLNQTWRVTWDFRTKLIYHPSPETRRIMSFTTPAITNLVLQFLSAGSDHAMSGKVIWEEI